MFKKEDLKFGDIITLRSGTKYIYVKNKIVREYGNYTTVDDFDEELKDIDGMIKFDIMKIERYCRAEPTRYYVLEILYERKEEILNEKEKEYLKNIISPFRNSVKFIKKEVLASDSNYAFIGIGYKDKPYTDIYIMMLPNFIKNDFYKNMELNKEYSLEELGL